MVHVARSSGGAAVASPRYPRFEIHADRCPQLLARIVGLFAARALIPTELHFRQSCGGLWIALHADMAPAAAERLAERLRSLVSVEAVILIHAPAGTPCEAIVGQAGPT